MSEVRRCPGCGSEVIVSDLSAAHSDGMHIGCNNVDEHDDGEPLVMWPQEDRDQ